MNENAEKLKELFKKKSAEAGKVSELEELRIEFLGKKGHIANLMSELRALPNDQKKEAGQKINTIKQFIETSMQERLQELKALEEQRLIESAEVYDESFPCDTNPGSYSPITLVQREVDEIFLNMGFSIEDYSEVTDDYNCFEALNIPKHHPARDMQDTFFIEKDPDILLRTHTSSIQVRTMERQKPPIRVICPGRVFRNEAISYRAHCIFHQIEGLYIDEGVSFADMKQSLLYFAKEVFGEQAVIRMRPSYFPFTEPSAEVDVSCNLCGGKGCNVCKGTGWLEIMGCGMVDPNVLEANGIDSKKYSGFAFGMGVERIAMLKYGVKDLRLYFENDVRFLHQFDTVL